MTLPIAAGQPRPGPLWGPYPSRDRAPGNARPRLVEAIEQRLRGPWRERRFRRATAAVRRQALPPWPELRARLSREGLDDRLVAQALARIAQAVQHTRGQTPQPNQLLAAWAMLNQRVVEMATGEGKSLALLMAAATAAAAGAPVHVVTPDDALAARDAEGAAPVLHALGLRVAAAQAGQDDATRRTVWSHDVVYCSARELGFESLHDTLAAPRLRGLCLALIDEADSVLIDHATQPLVLALPAPGLLAEAEQRELFARAHTLGEGQHFKLDAAARRATLTAAGLRALGDSLRHARDGRLLLHTVQQALVAMHALVRGRDYLCQGDEVVIVDPHTGRLSPGQQWTGGLHALVAIKEGLPLPPATGPAAQTSLQALFARYCRLGGASGTLREAALELAAVYGLAVMRVAPQRPSRHRALGWSFVANRAGLQRLVAERVAVQAALGRPVLVGTTSVSDSESLARWLAEHGLEVQTLNARHGSDERQRLARAGEPGVVTVTTAIAGRGADIQPGAAALAAGGLHVVLTAFQRSARLDRQFAGRAARQGQPGSSEQILCADDGTLALWLPKALRRGLAALPALAARPLLAALQRALGLHDALQRGQLLDEERRIRRALAFTLGPSTPLS